MNWNFFEISKSFLKDNKGNLLIDGKFGIEKESQRVTSTGDRFNRPSVSIREKTKTSDQQLFLEADRDDTP